MPERLRPHLDAALGATVVGITRVAGGSINEAFEVHLDDGRRVFAKTHAAAPPDFFEVEAEALDWLRHDDAVHLPRVIARAASPVAFLALEWIEPARHTSDSDARLGAGLAALHRAGAPTFGWSRPGYIGDLAQDNEPEGDWATFYRLRRLAPTLARAVDRGALPADAPATFDRLYERLADLTGPPEPPARLHGDLWGGNVLVGTDGTPWLIDPAPYGGHREMDLAMMRLFGGFGPRAIAAYTEVHPLADGHAERVGLYQLYPLLVHAVLFGGAYGEQAMSVVHRYV